MANNLTRNPWFVDTASANYLKSGAAAPANAGPLHIMSITWSGYTDATHKAIIKDPQTNAIFTFDGNSDLSPIELAFNKPLLIRDIAVSTLTSGILAVQLL